MDEANSNANAEVKASEEKQNFDLEKLTGDMVNNIGSYIKSEIDSCVADYQTLELMNKTVKKRYENYTDLAKSISGEMVELNQCYDSLAPLLAQINDIENCVNELEQTAAKLDTYSKKLEAKYKQLSEKR